MLTVHSKANPYVASPVQPIHPLAQLHILSRRCLSFLVLIPRRCSSSLTACQAHLVAASPAVIEQPAALLHPFSQPPPFPLPPNEPGATFPVFVKSSCTVLQLKLLILAPLHACYFLFLSLAAIATLKMCMPQFPSHRIAAQQPLHFPRSTLRSGIL